MNIWGINQEHICLSLSRSLSVTAFELKHKSQQQQQTPLMPSIPLHPRVSRLGDPTPSYHSVWQAE